jgi:adenine phosphoribosyltransferase
MKDARIREIERTIRDVPDFPKKGILFKDITPMLADPKAFVSSIDILVEQYAVNRPDVIVGIESRGFIFGAALSARMAASFVPARKPGKLPWKTDRVEYELEYGKDAVEMHVDAIPVGSKVLVVDDLIATGGTAWAACELVKKQGGELLGAAFVIELAFLRGRDRLAGTPVFSILEY